MFRLHTHVFRERNSKEDDLSKEGQQLEARVLLLEESLEGALIVSKANYLSYFIYALSRFFTLKKFIDITLHTKCKNNCF